MRASPPSSPLFASLGCQICIWLDCGFLGDGGQVLRVAPLSHPFFLCPLLSSTVFTVTAKVLGHSDISLDPPDKARAGKHTASGTGNEADTGTVVAVSPSVAVVCA